MPVNYFEAKYLKSRTRAIATKKNSRLWTRDFLLKGWKKFEISIISVYACLCMPVNYFEAKYLKSRTRAVA